MNKLICRKCNGNHLTIKCNNNIKKNESINTTIKKNESINNNIKNNNYIYKNEYKNFYKVKISELPLDISEKELYELLQDWGNIIKIIVKTYENSSSAYITFKNEIEVDYLVKAINSTVFEHRIINVEKLL